MESTKIRKCNPNDCKEIIKLIEELANYEKMPEGPKINCDSKFTNLKSTILSIKYDIIPNL